MAVGAYSWSLTAGSNGSADSNINFAEGQAPPTLNNSSRALMAALRAFVNALGGGATYGGSSSDYTITNDSPGTWPSYASGSIIALKANHTNDDTTVNVNVDALGNKRVKTADGGDPQIGDIVSGGIYLLGYDGTNFQLINTIGGGAYQPLDATLTALAALSTSADQYIYATGADTFALGTVTSFARTLLDDTTAANALTTLGVSAFAQTILDDANAAAVLATIGAVSLTASETIAGSKVFSSDPEINNDAPILILRDTDTAVSDGEPRGGVYFYTNDASNPNTLAGQLIFAGSGSIGQLQFQIRLGLTIPTTVFTLSPGGNLTVAGSLTVGSNIVSDTNNTDTLGTSGVRWANTYSVLGDFSGNLTLGGVGLGSAGSASAPAWSFSGDTNTGIYSAGSDVLGLAANGALKFSVNSSYFLGPSTGSPALTSAAGAVGGPAFTFTGDTDTGFYRIGDDNPGIAAGGALQAQADTGGLKDASGNPYLAAGKHTIPVWAKGMDSRTTNGAAAGSVELATNDVMLVTKDFDQTTEEAVQFMIPAPKSWNESTVTFQALWTAASGSGGVAWSLAGVAFSDGDAMDAAFGAAQVVTDTLTSANAMHITAESSAITIAGTPAEGDMIAFEIRRVVANGSDTLTADAKLIAIRLYMTLNAKNDE